MVYQNPGGSFSYTGPVSGGEAAVNPGGPNPCPVGATPRAYYHSHGGNDPKYDNENFSPADKNYAGHYGIDGYLATPDGWLKQYSPSTGATSTISPLPTR